MDLFPTLPARSPSFSKWESLNLMSSCLLLGHLPSINHFRSHAMHCMIGCSVCRPEQPHWHIIRFVKEAIQNLWRTDPDKMLKSIKATLFWDPNGALSPQRLKQATSPEGPILIREQYSSLTSASSGRPSRLTNLSRSALSPSKQFKTSEGKRIFITSLYCAALVKFQKTPLIWYTFGSFEDFENCRSNAR